MRLMTFSHFAQFGSIRMLCLGVWIRSDACRFRLSYEPLHEPPQRLMRHATSLGLADRICLLREGEPQVF